MILPSNFNTPEMMPAKRPAIVGNWILWKRLGHGRQLIEEHFCQAVRGGTVAELVTEPPFAASATHPRLEILAEMEVLAVCTSEQRAAEIAARVAMPQKPAQPVAGVPGGVFRG